MSPRTPPQYAAATHGRSIAAWASYYAIILLISVASPLTCVSSFELRKIFSVPKSLLPFGGESNSNSNGDGNVQTAKRELLETISNTGNGKESPLETQIKVLGLVDYLETEAPVSETLFENPNESKLIDGTWYLQYTQPSEPEGVDLDTDIAPWEPEESSLSTTKRLDTRKANNEGEVSFLGVISVDTSNKLTSQTIGVDTRLFANAVEQDFGTIEVSGFFEFDSVPNRIIASFETGKLTLKNGFVIDFSFLFALRAILKGGLKAGGWLETTYLDENLRIGRGNRGSLFVLTRNPNTVEA